MPFVNSLAFCHALRSSNCILASFSFLPAPSQAVACEPFVGLKILRCRFRDDIRRQHRTGRGFVPIKRFEIVADELFVEARLAATGLILVGRPETLGIRREHFVNQNEFAVVQTELKFRVRNDDAAFAGVIAGEIVNPQTRRTRLPGHVITDDSLRPFE